MKNKFTPFIDCRGKEVLPDDVIRILDHYRYDHLVGQEATLIWNSKLGLYEFHYENIRLGKVFMSSDDFYGVHRFEKI